MANNNYPQITSVTSESLQAQIRNLLPSQEGFGTDLMAQNVIVPVVDLTAAAEGTSTPVDLQQAWSFGAITNLEVRNATGTIVNNAGFWKVFASLDYRTFSSGAEKEALIFIDDGSTTKDIAVSRFLIGNGSTNQQTFEFVVFLRSGDSLKATSPDTEYVYNFTAIQIADINGNLILPSGFSPQ